MKKVLMLLLLVVFLTGCKATVDDNECADGFTLIDGECEIEATYNNTIINTFSSSDDIISLYNDYKAKQAVIDTYFGWRWMEFDAVAEDAAPTNDAEKGSDDYSETNNQVEGVDELDNVLTDGK